MAVSDTVFSTNGSLLSDKDIECGPKQSAAKITVHSHSRPVIRRKRGYILTADQSDAGSVGSCPRHSPARRQTCAEAHPTRPALPRQNQLELQPARERECWISAHRGTMIC
eukprot:5942880-Pyramimonas_sp.AAC.2